MRLKAGLTQQEIAAKMKVGQSAVSKLESGRDADLTLKEILTYVSALGSRHHISVVLDKEEIELELAYA